LQIIETNKVLVSELKKEILKKAALYESEKIAKRRKKREKN